MQNLGGSLSLKKMNLSGNRLKLARLYFTSTAIRTNMNTKKRSSIFGKINAN